MVYEKHADYEGHLYFAHYDAARVMDEAAAPVPHFHNSIEVWVVTGGEVELIINGEWHRLRAGDVVFMDRFTPHTGGVIREGDGAPSYYVLVASAAYLVNHGWLATETLPPITHRQEGFDDLVRVVEWNYRQYNDGMSAETRTGIVTLLLGYLGDYCGRVARESSYADALAVNTLIYINEHYKEPISLYSIARHFGYAHAHLSRAFNKYTGMHLRDYINRVRVCEILRRRRQDPSLSYARLAEECGYEHMTTFFRALKKYNAEEEKSKF